MSDCKDILKIVRGNGFTLRLQIEARRPDGSLVETFAIEGDEPLKVWHNGASESKPYERVGNDVYVYFDGDDELGWFGLEMTGVYADEPWRWYVPKVFQVVETNARANIPAWTILADDTYIIGCGITLLSAVVQADWDDSDNTSPSYIKNKPDLNEYATNVDLIATNQRVSTLEGNTVKTVAQSLSNLQKTTARNNISAASVAQVNTKQDTIADLSTIRSGAADGAVARGYFSDFSSATHTPAESAGSVLATVATLADRAQPRLTAGDNITITEDNVISATGGGGSADAVLYTPQTLTPEQQTQARSNISAYAKPTGGIPSTDLSSAVQTSLGKADSALQSSDIASMEVTTNKKATITGNESSTTYYPTTKAVADYVAANKTMVEVTYGVTTFAEVKALIDEGKIPYVLVTYGTTKNIPLFGSYLWLADNSPYTAISFYGMCEILGGTNNILKTQVKKSDDSWSAIYKFIPENSDNKKTSVSDFATNNNTYPTTKAVADYVSGIVGDINTILDEINGEVI